MNNIILLLVLISNVFFTDAYLDTVVPENKYALDLNLFEDVLDPELCDSQMKFIIQNDIDLLMSFLDAGYRTPRGILTGNTLDLGNYYQCLKINKEIPESVVEGKYCMIEVPLMQEINWPDLPTEPPPGLPDIPWLPDFPWTEFNPHTRSLNDNVIKRLQEYNVMKSGIDRLSGIQHSTRTSSSGINTNDISFKLAVCIPKVCSTRTALGALANISELGFQYEERFCRLPNDKPWRAGDYVAISIFSLIGLLAVLSTAYDLRHNIFLKRDPKKVNKLYQSFSIYNNTNRLVTYIPVPGAIECLDGIRSFAMMWVILGHTFVNQIPSGIMANPVDSFTWMISLSSVWITAGPITVDTFFMLSGLLLVYTINGKVTPMKLLKNLHMFYLNRILRIWPVLAATILIQISFLNWMVDGPYWLVNMNAVHNCRVNWWSTLLHIQNILNPSGICLSHTWYLAVDMQLYFISPLVLLWVLTGKPRVAWSALIGSLLTVLTGATIYNFFKRFPSATIAPSRPLDHDDFMRYYYIFPLTRASPFFVGLIIGYVLSIYRGKRVVLSRLSSTCIWITTICVLGLVVYIPYPTMQVLWRNQTADSLINSFMRPCWAAAVGWLIFACAHGYGGPVNWLLSHRMWKVLGRLSYAMYVTHYALQFTVNAMPVAPVYFNVPFSMLKFLVDFTLSVLVSFVITILVDSPCAVLIKHFIGGGVKKSPPNLEPRSKERQSIKTIKHKEAP